MKYLIILFLLIGSGHAQPTILEQYDAPINIDLPNDTVSGIIFKRKAEFEALSYNRRTKMVSIQWKVSYFSKLGVPIDLIPPYVVEQNATQGIYVFAADGNNAAWSEQELLEKYGVQDSAGNYIRQGNKWLLNRPGILDAYSFYNMAAEELPIPINTLMRMAGTRAAAEGRLDKK